MRTRFEDRVPLAPLGAVSVCTTLTCWENGPLTMPRLPGKFARTFHFQIPVPYQPVGVKDVELTVKSFVVASAWSTCMSYEMAPGTADHVSTGMNSTFVAFVEDGMGTGSRRRNCCTGDQLRPLPITSLARTRQYSAVSAG